MAEFKEDGSFVEKVLKGLNLKINEGLPNKLTLARMAAIPMLMVLYPWNFFVIDIICAVLFSLAAITDFLDGYIARKYQLVSAFGELIDPIADKMLVAAALILLTARGVMPSWVAILLISREFAVSGIRLVSLKDGVAIPVDTLGKYKTVLQDVGIVCLLVNVTLFDLSLYYVGMICLLGALGLSLYSAYFYWLAYWSTKSEKVL